MAKLLLWTLPVKHPRRAVILEDLAQYGDQYRKTHGVFPDWYISNLPLFQHVERLGGGGVPQTFTKTFSTAGINPYATLENAGSSLSTADPPKEFIRGALTPVAQSG
ncbi:MAG: hypothetical protein M3P18_26275 [Actinomycetota bacterium]|nr:hypothetical protein [Actinomycetota bacterium]